MKIFFRKLFASILIFFGLVFSLAGMGMFLGEKTDTIPNFFIMIFLGVAPLFFGIKLFNSKTIKAKARKIVKAPVRQSKTEPATSGRITGKARFVGQREEVVVAGKRLQSPMMFFVYKMREEAFPHVVDLKLPVRFTGIEEDLGYWPSYFDISPYSRGRLINWLALGRDNLDLDIGLLFIYFYGLEYRAIYERSDIKDILWEVMRLHQNYSFNRSFKQYSEGFISWLILSIERFTAEETERLTFFFSKIDSHSTLFSSGAYIKINDSSFTEESLFQMIASYENTSRSKIPNKLGRMFFDYYFTQINLSLSNILQSAKKVKVEYSYSCASSVYALRDLSNVDCTNYSLPHTTKEKLAKIWSNCIDDLRPLSRKLGKASKKQIFALLPSELKEIYSHPLSNAFGSFASKNAGNTCKVGDVANLLGLSFTAKLTIKQSKNLCQTIEDLGYNTEPDARYVSQSYKWDDFIVFYKSSDSPSVPQTSLYATASLLFDLGIYIARADSQIDNDELDVIETFIVENFCSNNNEIERIKIRRNLARVGVIKGAGVAKKLATKLKIADLTKVGNYLFMVAAADGVIDKLELKAIGKIFSDFGLDEQVLSITLEEYREKVTVVASTRITKGAKRKESGSTIPEQKVEIQQEFIQIDQSALKTILQDTNDVKRILQNVFDDEVINDEELEYSSSALEGEDGSNLSPDIMTFVEILIEKEQWPQDELRTVALENKIMLTSAIDTINSWAEKKTGDDLIFEEQGVYLIQQDILKELK